MQVRIGDFALGCFFFGASLVGNLRIVANGALRMSAGVDGEFAICGAWVVDSRLVRVYVNACIVLEGFNNFCSSNFLVPKTVWLRGSDSLKLWLKKIEELLLHALET